MEGAGPSPSTKKCPRCGEEIRAEAVVCRFCHARFEVTETAYCANDHKIVPVTPSGRCSICGGEVVDRTLRTTLIEEAAAPAPAAPIPPQSSMAPPPPQGPTPYYAPAPSAYPVPGGYPAVPGYVVPPRTSGLAIASLVLGLLWIWGIGSILALIFGYQGLGEVNRSNGRVTGKGLATAGVVLGWIGIAGAIALIALIAVAANSNTIHYGLITFGF